MAIPNDDPFGLASRTLTPIDPRDGIKRLAVHFSADQIAQIEELQKGDPRCPCAAGCGVVFKHIPHSGDRCYCRACWVARYNADAA